MLSANLLFLKSVSIASLNCFFCFDSNPYVTCTYFQRPFHCPPYARERSSLITKQCRALFQKNFPALLSVTLCIRSKYKNICILYSINITVMYVYVHTVYGRHIVQRNDTRPLRCLRALNFAYVKLREDMVRGRMRLVLFMKITQMAG